MAVHFLMPNQLDYKGVVHTNFKVRSNVHIEENAYIDGKVEAYNGFSGDGSNLSNLDMDEVSHGILDTQYGGTGHDFLTHDRVLIGNGNGNIIQDADLAFDVQNSRLAVGHTSPDYTLDVSGDMRVTHDVRFESDITIHGNGKLTLSDDFEITGQNDLRPSQLVQENNKIGIGSQTDPQYQLDVGGDMRVSQHTRIEGELRVLEGINADGSNLSNLDVDKVSLGTLDVEHGGTGRNSLTNERVLIGNGTSSVTDTAHLSYDVSNNRLAIGHTSPSSTLDVNGSIYASGDFTWTGDKLGVRKVFPDSELDVDGTIHASGDVEASSDRRIKSDIQPIDNVMQRMMGVHGKKYTRPDMSSKKGREKYHIGFIAQELKDVVPECVTYSETTDLYSVTYGNMVALLAEAFHVLHDRLISLEKHCGKI